MTAIHTSDLDTAEVTRVMQQFDTPKDPDWCGWTIHRSTEDPTHVLITCDVPDSWALTMPGQATRQGIGKHLMRYAYALREGGFGIAMWQRDGQPRALIVTTDQRAVDEVAPGIREHLTELNKEAPDA